MKFNNLLYFKTVAEYGNITRAAKELYITQPALSKTIHALEEEAGCQLFDRSGKQITLNRQGEIYYKYVLRILGASEDVQKEIDDSLKMEDAQISIQLDAAAEHFVSLLADFQRKNPHIHYCLLSAYLSSSHAESPDLTIFAEEAPLEDPNSLEIYVEDLVLAVPLGHPLAEKESVSSNDLRDIEFLIASKGSALRSAFERYCREHQFCPRVAYETYNFSLLKSMVANGLGCSLIPSFSWRHVKDKSLCRTVPIQDISFRRHVYIKWREERYLSDACSRLLSYLILQHSTYDL